MTGPVTGRVAYEYNSNFKVTNLGFNGSAVVYGYDADCLLTNAGSLVIMRSMENGMIQTTRVGLASDVRDVNGFGALAQYRALYATTNLLEWDYGYDTAGRITSRVETIVGATTTYAYVYDNNGWLLETRTNDSVAGRYQYDANGNRTNAQVRGVGYAAQYDAQDRLLSYGVATYQYSARGTLTNRLAGGTNTAYRYDTRGSLREVRWGTNGVQYAVDPLGRRIGKTHQGVVTRRWVYQDYLKPVAELDGAGALVTRFVYATHRNVPDYLERTGRVYRVYTDHLGSVRLVVDVEAGAIAQRLDYDEWGNVTLDTNPGFQPFGFAGGLYDPDTGLTRFGYRDYDAATGRWLAKDPILFGGGDVNLYVYCANEPISHSDTDGRVLVPVCLCVITFVKCFKLGNEMEIWFEEMLDAQNENDVVASTKEAVIDDPSEENIQAYKDALADAVHQIGTATETGSFGGTGTGGPPPGPVETIPDAIVEIITYVMEGKNHP
jgi:RHS repeat-associated protein